LASYGTAQTMYSPAVTADLHGRVTMSAFASVTDVNAEATMTDVASSTTPTPMIFTGMQQPYFPQFQTPSGGNTFDPTTGIVTIANDGWYLVSGTVTWTANIVPGRNIDIFWTPLGFSSQVVASEYNLNPASATPVIASASKALYLVAGDIVSAAIFQISGTPLTCQVIFSVTWLHK